MLSDIYGYDKKEKYLIIFNLLKDGNVFGIAYGKKGIGKKFIIKKAVNEISKEKDKKVFLEAGSEWHRVVLKELKIDAPEPISKEEFFMYFVDFVEKFSGRIFIVINNIQKLSEKQIKELYHLLGLKEKVSVISIGDESLKNRLNPFKIGRMETFINFIFEIKPPEFPEFERYFQNKYGNKIDKKAVKKLYSLSEGSIQQAEELILQIGKFPIKGSDIKTPYNKKSSVKLFILTGSVFLIGISLLLFFKNSVKQTIEPEKIIKMDKKLPVEGSVAHDLPVKTKKKKKQDILSIVGEIKEEIGNLRLEELPQVKFYKKPVKYIIQVASFKNMDNALKLKEKISQDLPGVEILERKNGIKSVVIYASDKEEAGKIINKLKIHGLKPLLKKVK
ncbi:SPOR domain-containing protein [Persephonella sp.]|uniref:SPOR domain-containing protein n=1 Tax=Persephonella sp. TaxID=2060922 RepID=UPI0025CC5C7F|nr:SPOR domain-containing protein [Persephonella sp.]